MIFHTVNGFNLLTGKLKVENHSQHPVIFKQPYIDNPEEEDRLLQNLLTRLVFEPESSNILYEDLHGKQKHIVTLNGNTYIEDLYD
jgi:hypothetical protein